MPQNPKSSDERLAALQRLLDEMCVSELQPYEARGRALIALKKLLDEECAREVQPYVAGLQRLDQDIRRIEVILEHPQPHRVPPYLFDDMREKAADARSVVKSLKGI